MALRASHWRAWLPPASRRHDLGRRGKASAVEPRCIGQACRRTICPYDRRVALVEPGPGIVLHPIPRPNVERRGQEIGVEGMHVFGAQKSLAVFRASSVAVSPRKPRV